ncbi:MAG: metal-dependent transcriptional regulator [Candidatus Geothermarchaeales archaeon]
MTNPRPKDYIRTIYTILEDEGRSARVTEIARRLGVAPATVTEMVKKLVEEGFVDHRKWG